jgi:hypothetical protein
MKSDVKKDEQKNEAGDVDIEACSLGEKRRNRFSQEAYDEFAKENKEYFDDLRRSFAEVEYTYNDKKDIRTSYAVDKLYETDKGFIGRLFDVQYKQSDGSWMSKGSRWLINEDDPQVIMAHGNTSSSF